MTYDQWKTTDPRDYEPEQEEAPSELEDCFEKIRELQDDAKHAADVHAKRVKELEASLLECLEYFQDRADIASEHDEDGSPRPNKEMRLGMMIEETLHGIRF